LKHCYFADIAITNATAAHRNFVDAL